MYKNSCKYIEFYSYCNEGGEQSGPSVPLFNVCYIKELRTKKKKKF